MAVGSSVFFLKRAKVPLKCLRFKARAQSPTSHKELKSFSLLLPPVCHVHYGQLFHLLVLSASALYLSKNWASIVPVVSVQDQ